VLHEVTDTVLAECVDLDPDDSSTRRRGSDGRSVWIEPSARHHTSSGVLAQEEHIICWAMDAQLEPPAPSTGVNTGRLDVMQAEAAAAVAGSDRLVLVVGPAGAGKTTMLAAAVDDLTAGTSLVEIRGVGVVVAAMIIGQTGDISRFASAGHFASYNATAPIEASSGQNTRHRLNQRGNRQLNWAIHTAAVTQLRYPCQGREYYDRKRAEGKDTKEAIRALKRQLSNVIYRTMVADARRLEQ